MAYQKKSNTQTDKTYTDWKKEINENSLQPVYLICGQEAFLKKLLLDHITKLYLKTDVNEFNYTKIKQQDLSPNAVVNEANQLPFFTDKRILIIEDPAFIKCKAATKDSSKDEDTEETKESNTVNFSSFIEYLSNPNPGCLLILYFNSKAPDKRDKTVKAINELNAFINIEKADDGESRRILESIAEKNKKSVTVAVINQIISGCSGGLTQQINEMNKLITYSGNETALSPKMAEDILSTNIEVVIFNLIDHIAQKEIIKAVGEYREILNQGSNPFIVLSMIIRQYRQLLLYKTYYDEKMPPSAIMQTLGIRYSGIFEKIQRQARAYTKDQLMDIFGLLQKADLDTKSTSSVETATIIEDLIVKLGRF